MKTRYFLLTLVLGLGLAWALLWAVGGQTLSAVAASNTEGGNVPDALAAELRVCPSGCPYSSVQAAVDAARYGDVIKVAAGVYTDIHARPAPPYMKQPPGGLITQTVYISKAVTIQGGYTTTNWTTSDPTANPTILDAQQQGRVIFITGLVSPTIAGFRITGGDANNLGGGNTFCDVGGGIYSNGASPIIRENWIYSNTAGICQWNGNGYVGAGGGIYADGDGYPVILSNTIRNNQASYAGGGICTEVADAIIEGNTIADNRAYNEAFGITFGGGLFLNNQGTIARNRIENNASQTEGGGIWSITSLSLTNNIILSNTSARGGGIFVILNTTYFANNVIAHNHAVLGGALYVTNSYINSWHDTLIDNQDQYGAAIAFTTNAAPRGTISMTNAVIVSSTAGFTTTDRATVILDHVLWHNVPITVAMHPSLTLVAQNQYYGDPAFAADGYHLTAGSAALNRGVFTDIVTDIDGEPRRSGPAPDLGADEFQEPPVLPGVPVQISPPNGTVTTTATVTLQWIAGGGGAPEGYHLDLDGTVITTTSTSYATSLSIGAHTWRVRAFNAAGYSAWTELWTVKVEHYQIYLPLVKKNL